MDHAPSILSMENSEEIPYAGAQFERDMFVSYSHGIRPHDASESDLKIWTRALVGKLTEHIGYSLDVQHKPVRIWYDDKLSGAAALTDALKTEVENSATLLIIMTNQYLSSEWCKKERDWFETEVRRRGGGVDNVFVVRAMPTENEQWPNFLKDGFGETVLGYRFCAEEKGKAARPFGWVNPDQSKTYDEFVESLTDLASNIATRLDDIRKESELESPASVEEKSKGETSSDLDDEKPRWPVYVIPGTEDVQHLVTEVRGHLENGGCTVLPPKEISIGEITEGDQDQALSIAQSVVQLLGVLPERVEGEDFGLVQALNRSAREKAVPQFLWRNTKIPLDALNHDPPYRQFIESLGSIPDRSHTQLADEVLSFLNNRDPEDSDQSLLAYLEGPGQRAQRFQSLEERYSD